VNVSPVLEVRNLTTSFEKADGGHVDTLSDFDLTLEPGEIVGVVGETGAGKTVLLRTILGVFHEREAVRRGEVLFEGSQLPILDDEAMRPYRGSAISLILSGQRARLDPVRRIGDQLLDVMNAHRVVAKRDRAARAEELLRSVGIPAPAHNLRAYPHELSGGMSQRIVIALALANGPRLLMADEPTAGLDVTIQVQILDLFRQLVAETGAASILATRDLAQAAHYCDRIVVLRDGKVVEQAPVKVFFAGPGTAYGRELLEAAMAARGEGPGDEPDPPTEKQSARPRSADAGAEPAETVLEVQHLVKHFRTARHTVHAVNDVSFTIQAGRTLALVGESGSGKTTIGRCIAGLLEPTAGEIRLLGRNVVDLSAKKRARSAVLETQVVFQEPRESLNPRWTLGQSIEEPLRHHGDSAGAARARRVLELLDLVGLPAAHAELYPHQTSAGVQQRVAVARAIAVEPRLVVLDEPTSALDMSVKVQIIELLIDLQRKLGVSYLFISHDMTAVKMIAHELAIMYLGRVFEQGPAQALFEKQLNPYGRALLSAVLYPDPEHEVGQFRLEGEIPSAIDLPKGCALASRCPLADERSYAEQPPLEPVPGLGRSSACFRTPDIVAAGGVEQLQEQERAGAAQGSGRAR
jgi:peptide/nickel transport system ATP-binding protein